MKLFGGFSGERTKRARAAAPAETEPMRREPTPEEPAEAAAARKSEEPPEQPEETPEAAAENAAPAADEAGENEAADEAGEENSGEGERQRTPEELAEIEEIIAAYQKKKKRRRFIALGVIVLLIAAGLILWKTHVKPPEPVQPTAKPSPSATAKPSPTPVSGAEPTEEPIDEPAERKRRENVHTFLLVGREQSYGNTDTIMVGVYDENAGTVDIVSIPRDTCANVESDPKKSETKKINSVFARADIEGLEDAVADIVGFPIDCYVSVGVNGFTQLVNTIGGVNFNVPYRMDYDDPTQDLHIHFSPGEQYLNGYDAIKVVRWRQNNDGSNYGDIARINTQQSFLKAVIKQCLSLSNLASNLDDYLDIFREYVKTDLSTGNMAWYAKQFLKLDMDNIRFHTLASNYTDSIHGFSYGTILVDEWLEQLNEYLNVYDQPITIDDIDVISRDENGELYATSGEIRGGEESFLRYEDYIARLNEWNAYLASLNKDKEEPAEAGGSDAEETAAGEAAGGETENAGEAAPAEAAPETDTNGGE